MKRIFVIDRDLFARSNVAQGKEQDVPMDGLDVSVRFAAVIDVMRAVAAAAAVQTPATIDVADAKFRSTTTALSF